MNRNTVVHHVASHYTDGSFSTPVSTMKNSLLQQEDLGRTNYLLSFNTTRIAQNTKKLGGIHRHTDSNVIS
jgi:hypothetical protein